MPFARYALAALLFTAAPAALVTAAAAQVSSQEATMATTAIISAGQRAATVARIDRVPAVGAVRLKPQIMRLNEEDEGDFTNFAAEASRHHAGIARLRAALARNPATARALARHHIDISDVVGVMVSSDGSLRLYLL